MVRKINILIWSINGGLFDAASKCICAPMVELADTPDLGSGGRPWGFKSLDAHQNNTVHRSARWILFYLPNMRSWRNWQTRTVQVRVRRLMGVRIPLTAPIHSTSVGCFFYDLTQFFEKEKLRASPELFSVSF